jgi:NTE family protein
VDALTGDFVVWDASSKVGLARAVASSCSVPGVYPPITINGRRYIDGGMRSGSNADLAKGHDLVLILAIRTASAPAGMRAPLEREMDELKAAGSRVETIYPDEASMAAFGANMMNAMARPAAAKAGLEQGRALGQSVGAYWR